MRSAVRAVKYMKRSRKMLNNWNAPYLQLLVKQIETQSKQTLARWAADYAERVLLPLWSKHYPDDSRPRNALAAANKWLTGEIKLPEAKARRRFTQPATVSASRCTARWQSRSTASARRRRGNRQRNAPRKSAAACSRRCAPFRLTTSRTRRKSVGSAEGGAARRSGLAGIQLIHQRQDVFCRHIVLNGLRGGRDIAAAAAQLGYDLARFRPHFGRAAVRQRPLRADTAPERQFISVRLFDTEDVHAFGLQRIEHIDAHLD